MDARLFVALDSAGIAYNKRDSSRGVPYAGFKWCQNPTMGESAITAIIEENVLRLSVYGVNVRAEPAILSKSARPLPLGSVYVSPDDGGVEISLGLYIGDIAELSLVLHLLLDYLDKSRCWLEGRAGGRLACPDMPRLSSIPSRNGQDIAPYLIGYRHQPSPIENGAKVTFKLNEQLSLQLEVRERPDAWFVADSRYAPAAQIAWGQPELLLLQKLQRWAAAGRFILEDSGDLRAEVLTPNLGQPPKELIAWTISQSTLMLQVAARHLNIGITK